jgi:DNA-binding GntR family transcriptional regulator
MNEDESMESRIENKSLRQNVYEKIRGLIDNGELAFGEKINKLDLADRFSVSQTPINDALNRLVGENYLIQQSRKGYYVKEFDFQEFCNLFEMRAGLEGIAARLCCERATDEELHIIITSFDSFSLPMNEEERIAYTKADKEFHRNILKFSRNPTILDALYSTGFLTRSYQKGLIRGPEITLQEHKKVIEPFKVRDGDLAQQNMVEHLLNSRNLLRELVKKSS